MTRNVKFSKKSLCEFVQVEMSRKHVHHVYKSSGGEGGTYNLNLSEHKVEMLLHCRPPMNLCILHLSPITAGKWQSPLKRVPGLLPCFGINNIYLSQALGAF